MGYYDQPDNVNEYIKQSPGYTGTWLMNKLNEYLSEGTSVLELGIGPGKDLDILKERYKVTGSDFARPFLDLYHKRDPTIPLLLLNAVTLETDNKFDCIYSNKVLYHLQKKEMIQSLERQADLLNPHGIVAHSFWKGDKEEDYLDLHFVYYKKSELRAVFSKFYRIIFIGYYKEEKAKDSIFVIARKR